MTQQRPSFRHIAPPLDVDDGALARLADQMGVPTLTKPAAPTPVSGQELGQDAPIPAPRPSPSRKAEDSPKGKKSAVADPPRTALEKMTVEIPGYLLDAIKREALNRRSTNRHVLMLALQTAGFTVHPQDLIRDARRTSRKPTRS